MDLVQQQTKLNELNGEIRIAERTLEKLHEDIEALDSTKKAELKEYKERIKKEKEKLENLTTESSQLTTAIKEGKEAKTKLEGELKAYGENEITKAKEAVGEIYTAAQKTKQEAEARLAEAKTKEEELEKREVAAETLDREATEQKEKNTRKEIELKTLQEETDVKVEVANKTVVEANKKVDNLNREIAVKTAKNKGLDITIELKQKAIDQKEAEAQHKMSLAILKQITVDAQMKGIEQTKIDQKNEAIRLKDWAATLRRAHQEIKTKGAVN